MIVDPAPGALVRDPDTLLELSAGATVDENAPYWARLIADGDLVAPPAPASRRAAASTNEGDAK